MSIVFNINLVDVLNELMFFGFGLGLVWYDI